MIRYTILGKSNFAISIILDIIASQEAKSKDVKVDIVSNIDDDENPSLDHPFQTRGITTREVNRANWVRNDSKYIVGSIGRSREEIVRFFEENFSVNPGTYCALVHSSAVLPIEMRMGAGAHIGPQAVVAPYAEMGNFVAINRCCSVGHHTSLGDYVSLGPGVHVAGLCKIAKGVTMGTGATVINEISIGANSVIGAGSVVTRDIPAGVVAYGVPAKVVRNTGS